MSSVLKDYFLTFFLWYFVPLICFANSTEGSMPQVVFFGGYGSNQNQMTQWKSTAEKNIKYKNKFKFESVLINANKPDKATVVASNKNEINAWVEKIDNSSQDSHFILAGHSSGSALSNEIARKVKHKSKIELVVLDGYSSADILGLKNSFCWSSADADDAKKISLNMNSMKKCKNYFELKQKGCTNSMCLHFSLVNLNAAKVPVTSKNFKANGYDQLVPNLMWLDVFLKPNSEPEPNSRPTIKSKIETRQ